MTGSILVAVFALSLLQDPATPSVGRGDSLSGASIAVAPPIPAALRDGDVANATLRQGKTFWYDLKIPAGEYQVEIGFLELIWRRPSQRVFDVFANGSPLFEALDLVAEAGPAPSRLMKTGAVTVAEQGLKLTFRARNEEATVAWIRVRDGSGTIVRTIDCGGDGDPEPPGVDSPLSEQVLARFGSRAFLDLRPQWGNAEISPLGKFAEKPLPFVLGFEVDGTIHALPFARDLKLVRGFESVEESRTITRLRYDVTLPGLEGSIEIRAPFHPGDLMASSLPAFRVEFCARRTGEAAPKSIAARVMFFTTSGGPRSVSLDDGLGKGVVLGSVGGKSSKEWGIFVTADETDASFFQGLQRIDLTLPLPLAEGEARGTAWIVAFSDAKVLSLDGRDYRPAYYHAFHRSIERCAVESIRRDAELEAASDVVDSLVEDSSLPDSLKSLLRVALPSMILNTVLAEDGKGDRWYSCLEGYCRYHATLDVEAHTLPFYTWFAPELLRLELSRIANCVSADDVVCHDLGIGAEVGAQKYPHAMPIEENTNFVLLLHAYWAATADDAFVLPLAPLVARLLARVRACDDDGDGLAETGVANTIDDGSAAVQYSRGQTYLAVKTAAAHLAGAELAERSSAAGADGHGAAVAEAGACRAYAARIRESLEARSWRGTHWALAADASAKGLVNPWGSGVARPVSQSSGPVPPEVAIAPTDDVLEGADSAHGLAALGAIFALRTFGEPPVPLDRLRLDLATAGDRTARRLVDAHAEHEINGWVSLSLVRDAARAYLGDDPLERCDRYAELQHRRNRQDDLVDFAGFCDSPYNRYLSYYPRGAVALALVDAVAGLRLDRRAMRIELAPLRAPLRVPLPALADWKAARVPWLEVTLGGPGGSEPQVTIRDGDLLKGFDVTIDLTKVGGARTTWTPPEK